MRINTNLTAMNTFTQYTKNNSKIASSVAKLSSGSAINSAADNATGLAISEKMRAQIRGLEKASTNAQDAISLVQSAEGALSSSTEILQRMRELAVQSASDTNENEIDRTALQDEFSQLQNELNDIAKNTTFNKKTLLDGSLATQTKNLGNTTLANSGMTIQLGDAATGSYNFSVTTRLEAAAVTAEKPDTPELVMDGAADYFNEALSSVGLGASVKASDLLNGNYTLSASYADPTNDNGDGQIKVTATGDNGQTFEATISATALADLDSDKTLNVRFNSTADDSFNLTLELSNFVEAGEDNYDTLADSISKLTVSVSGGVTAKDAEYGVYANLTGAESVKLESGMNSVTFDNGVKVNFSKLTASAVDTKNDVTIATGDVAVANPTAASGLAAMTNSIGGQAVTGATWDFAAAEGKIAEGGFSVTDDASGNMTLTDSTGKTYTATGKVTTAAATNNLTYNFTSTDGSNVTFNATLDITAGAAFTAGAAVTMDGTVNGAIGYALSSETAATGSANLSNIKFTDDTIVSNGNLTFSTSTSGGNVTFTATDGAGTSYTATVAEADLESATTYGMETNKLTFVNNKGTGFSADLVTINEGSAGADGTTFQNASQLTEAITNAGHNYTKIFGAGVDGDLDASTTSSFSVEATKNAGLTFQVGANEGDAMVINIDKMDANYLGVASASVSTRTAATSAIDAVDSAINQVSSQRAYLGAIQNRLEYKISNLNTSTENLTSAESQIRDVDMAKEMTAFTNANILNQASTAMLAQANSLPQAVLSLIGG